MAQTATPRLPLGCCAVILVPLPRTDTLLSLGRHDFFKRGRWREFMTFGTLYAWYVAMRGLLLSPFPGRPLLQVVHRRAETEGAECERRCLRTVALGSLFVCCLFVHCMTAGRGATEVHGCCVPAPVLFSISNLLRVACFLFSVFFGPFYLT